VLSLGQQLMIPMLCDPVGSHQMTIVHVARPFRFIINLDSKKMMSDFRKRGTVGFSIQEARVKLQLSTIIFRDGIAFGWCIDELLIDLICHPVPLGGVAPKWLMPSLRGLAQQWPSREDAFGQRLP